MEIQKKYYSNIQKNVRIKENNISFKAAQTAEAQNTEVSRLFNECYNAKSFPYFIQYINNSLPILPSTGNTSIKVNEKGHIQLIHPEFQRLFSSSEELSSMGDGATIIGDGIRGLDPASQSQWKLTSLNREWPPSEHQKVTTTLKNNGNSAIFETQENPDYKVKTKGMVNINPDGSIIWAYQQENNNPDIKWAAWTVAPFKVPQGKKALSVFPVSKNWGDKYAKNLMNNNQWIYDRENSFVTVKPGEKGGFFDPFDSATNWYAYAIEGSDKVVVMQSIYKQPFEDKSKSCLVSDNAGYIEHEFMAPKAAKGEKSTIACKLTFVSLTDLDIKDFQRFDPNNMDAQVKQVFSKLKEKLG